MKNYCIAILLAILFSISVKAQQTRFYSDPEEKFKEAKEYYQKEQYSLAYPLLKELQESVQETDKLNNAIMVEEVNYYTIACALKQNEGRAEEMAKNYIQFENLTSIKTQLDYIHRNPVRDRIVMLPEDYLYSSASDYAGIKGLVNVQLITEKQEVDFLFRHFSSYRNFH